MARRTYQIGIDIETVKSHSMTAPSPRSAWLPPLHMGSFIDLWWWYPLALGLVMRSTAKEDGSTG